MNSVFSLLAAAIALAAAGCTLQDPLSTRGISTYVKVPNRVVSQDFPLRVEIGFVNRSKHPVEIYIPLDEQGLSLKTHHVFVRGHREGGGPMWFGRGEHNPTQLLPGDTLKGNGGSAFRFRVRPGPYRVKISGSVQVDGEPHRISPRPRWVFFRNSNPYPDSSFVTPAR